MLRVDFPRIRSFTFKIASRCNLNCTYCYVYNKQDNSWRDRPAVMADDIYEQSLDAIAQHCDESDLTEVSLCFHGGEPCLIGPRRFEHFCNRAQQRLAGIARPRFQIQTNGTLLDDRWAELFARYQVDLGVSLDGPASIHDIARLDQKGRGSHAAVRRGLKVLERNGHPFSLLCVIPLGADALEVHAEMLSAHPASINYLFPDVSLAEAIELKQRNGERPIFEFLAPLIAAWWDGPLDQPEIVLFRQIATLILGGPSRIDTLGNGAMPFVFIEADGAIEGLDVLKAASSGLAATPWSIGATTFRDIVTSDSLLGQCVRGDVAKPQGCRDCRENATCGGGYLPHRFHPGAGFDHPSFWCADILALFDTFRDLLNVDHEETLLRSRALAAIKEERATAMLHQS